jgi:hypothetical protein
LEFDISEIKDNQIDELKKFHKSYFDVESIVATASELKYTGELKHLIQQELNQPSPEFVRHFAKQVYPSVVTAKVLEQFTILIKKSFQQFSSDLITERLKTALKRESEVPQPVVDEQAPVEEINKIVTTADELEAYMIVKTILRQKVNASRIAYRDAQSYFAILLDDNRLKTICRLYFNSSKKYIAFLDDQKKEVKTELQSLDDIFSHAEKLIQTLDGFEKGKQ